MLRGERKQPSRHGSVEIFTAWPLREEVTEATVAEPAPERRVTDSALSSDFFSGAGDKLADGSSRW